MYIAQIPGILQSSGSIYKEVLRQFHRTAKVRHEIKREEWALQRLASMGPVGRLLPCCLVIGSWQGLESGFRNCAGLEQSYDVERNRCDWKGVVLPRWVQHKRSVSILRCPHGRAAL